jgi:D-alanyl-D-alanine carboxypeptidase/D-alanyl-D-alanine-endopeptidase (penicillin-binding protein 4)
MARLIFLRLGTKYQSYDLNAGLSTRVMLNYLRENKIDTSGITFENGCGLSQIERISAKQMTDILALAYTKPFFKVFLDSLPLVGIDGTMKNRLHDISGMASLKTGTLNNVRAIAGYISDGKGGYFAISAMVNSENANKSSPALDELVRWVASYELSK